MIYSFCFKLLYLFSFDIFSHLFQCVSRIINDCCFQDINADKGYLKEALHVTVTRLKSAQPVFWCLHMAFPADPV
ncbi:hypothetical protein AAZV13_10G174900 [Glycine max]